MPRLGLRGLPSFIPVFFFFSLILAGNDVPAQAAQAINARPTNGTIGTVVTVTGSGWQPNHRIGIAWDFNYNNNVTTPSTNASGAFTTSIIVPSGISLGTNYIDAEDQTTDQTAQAPFTVAQAGAGHRPTITNVRTYTQGALVYFVLSFIDSDKNATGFGFRAVNGSGWGKADFPFSNPSYGVVSLRSDGSGTVTYPFNHLCGQPGQYESDVSAWIYDGNGHLSPSVIVHFACGNDFRNQVLNRARSWIKARVPYNQQAYRDGYRTDCSGFVSYAWQIKVNGQPISPNTVGLGSTYTKSITFNTLKPGDIINNNKWGNSGHVVIFVNWIDQGRTRFVAYEENGGYGRAIQSSLTLINASSGTTIKEYDSNAPGPYYAQIYKNAP